MDNTKEAQIKREFHCSSANEPFQLTVILIL